MSWLYSRALVEAFSVGSSSDGGLFAPLKSTDMPQAFWSLDKMMVTYRPSRFGMTFGLLTEDRGKALLKSFQEASRAKISRRRAKVAELKANARACGQNLPVSFAKYNLNTCSWRTHPCSPPEESTEFSGTWPKWGSMRDGECSVLSMLVPRTFASASGLWPTPNKMDALDSWSMLEPAHWQARSIKAAARGIHLQLSLRVAVFLTKEPHPQNEKLNHLDVVQLTDTGFRLNPDWVEWLMGWPIGWTDLRPLAMDRFQQWRDSHGRL